MSGTPVTSAVYAAWRFLTRLCGEVSWPAAPVGADPVESWFGDPDRPPPNVAAALERVVVIGAVESPPSSEWGPVGNQARDERFRCGIYIETGLAGRTAMQVADRLEELTAELENAIRTVNADRRGGAAPVEFADRPSWQVAWVSTMPKTPPAQDGYVGAALVTVDFEMRVGTIPA